MLGGLLQILLGCNAEVLPAVTHHVRGGSYPNWMGHDQILYYPIDGSHLVLSSPPILDHGEWLDYTLTLAWV